MGEFCAGRLPLFHLKSGWCARWNLRTQPMCLIVGQVNVCLANNSLSSANSLRSFVVLGLVGVRRDGDVSCTNSEGILYSMRKWSFTVSGVMPYAAQS